MLTVHCLGLPAHLANQFPARKQSYVDNQEIMKTWRDQQPTKMSKNEVAFGKVRHGWMESWLVSFLSASFPSLSNRPFSDEGFWDTVVSLGGRLVESDSQGCTSRCGGRHLMRKVSGDRREPRFLPHAVILRQTPGHPRLLEQRHTGYLTHFLFPLPVVTACTNASFGS